MKIEIWNKNSGIEIFLFEIVEPRYIKYETLNLKIHLKFHYCRFKQLMLNVAAQVKFDIHFRIMLG